MEEDKMSKQIVPLILIIHQKQKGKLPLRNSQKLEIFKVYKY